MEVAPCPSDIIWENYKKKMPFNALSVFLLNVLLFALAVVVFNPNVVSFHPHLTLVDLGIVILEPDASE